MDNRFARTELLIGKEGLCILSSIRVMVFGLGGVGSYAAEALARSAVGRLALVDYDVVAPSNINRQIHAFEDTLGMPKAVLMAERIKRINPLAEVEVFQEKYEPGMGDRFFSPAPDYVVDAIDDVEAKVDLIASCLSRGIRLVSSMGAGNKMDPAMFRVDDLSRSTVCPLARSVRQRLRKMGVAGGFKVVYSTERPGKRELKTGEYLERTMGSISFVPPVAGMMLAGVAVRDILAANEAAGK